MGKGFRDKRKRERGKKGCVFFLDVSRGRFIVQVFFFFTLLAYSLRRFLSFLCKIDL